jgi:hypothetical protein
MVRGDRRHQGERMRSVKVIVAVTVVALALTGCRSSSKASSPDKTAASSGNRVSAADFCAKVKDEVDAFDVTGISVKSPDELRHTYHNLAPRLEKLASEAPSEIASDFQTFVTLEKKLDAVLADADYDPTQLSLSALPELASPSTLSALRNIGTYFRTQCHFGTGHE